MSSQIRWEILQDGGVIEDLKLKRILEGRYLFVGQKILTIDDLPFFEGLKAAFIEGVEPIMAVLSEGKEIKLTMES